MTDGMDLSPNPSSGGQPGNKHLHRLLRFLSSVQGTLLVLLLVMVIPGLLFELCLHYNRFQVRRDHELQANLELARSVGATFEAWVMDILGDETAIGAALTAPHPPSDQSTNELLRARTERHPSLRQYSWLDRQGRVVNSSAAKAIGLDMNDRAPFRQIVEGRGWVVSDLFQGQDGQVAFVIASGVRDQSGTLQGVVVAVVDPTRLGKVLAVQRAGEGAIVIIDSRGWGVYRYPEIEMAWEQRNWNENQPLLAEALSGVEATGTLTSHVDGSVRMAGLSPITSIGWVASASRTEEEAMAPVSQDLLTEFATLVSVTIVALGVALYFGRRITVPTKHLREYAQALERGELHHRAKISGPPELEDLCEALNRMAEARQAARERNVRLFEAERAAHAEAKAAREQVVSVLESITDAFFAMDRDARFIYVNKEAERILRRSRKELIGKLAYQKFRELSSSRFGDEIRRAVRQQVTVEFEFFYPALDIWVEVHAYPSKDGLTVYLQDITKRKRDQEAMACLAQAGAQLASSLDYQNTLQTVARLAVPTLGDLCIVDIVEGYSLQRVAIASTDPSKEELWREIARRYRPDPNRPYPAWQVVRTGKPYIIPEVTDATWAAIAEDADHLDLLRRIASKSYLSVPLVARGRTMGVMSFRWIESNRRYGADDLPLAEGLARHAALAIDNARLYREAREAISARDEFLSVAAHELKTPVTSMRGFAQLIIRQFEKEGVLDPLRVRQAFQVIDRQSDKLSRLVSQLLDISRIQAEQLVLDRSIVDIVTLVEGVVAVTQPMAHRHTLVVRAPSSLPVLVDSLRLEQVLTNLVDNAIKYSPDGGEIDIEVSKLNPELLRLAVRDRGIGVPPEHRQRIFERFFRAHASEHYGGLGLGLYISRQIVNLHGGELEVEFPPDGGTRFIAILPIALGDGGAPADAPHAVESARSRGNISDS